MLGKKLDLGVANLGKKGKDFSSQDGVGMRTMSQGSYRVKNLPKNRVNLGENLKSTRRLINLEIPKSQTLLY